MRTKNKHRLSRKIVTLIIVGFVVTLALAGIGVYAAVFHGNIFGWTPFPAPKTSDSNPDVNYGPATDEEIDTGTGIKEENADSGTKPNESTDGETTTSNITISIPYSAQIDGSLRVTTQIDKVTSSGTCTLTLSRSGYESITMTAGVQAQNRTSTCMGFTVTQPLAAGNWNLRIDYADGINKGSVSKDQMIQ